MFVYNIVDALDVFMTLALRSVAKLLSHHGSEFGKFAFDFRFSF